MPAAAGRGVRRGSETTDDEYPGHATGRERRQRHVLPAPLAQRVLNEVVESIAVHALVTPVTPFLLGQPLRTGQPASSMRQSDRQEADLTEKGSATEAGVEEERVLERKHWAEGPPHELFKRMRSECPVHWTPGVSEFPAAAGFWSVTRADDVHAVSRDWETYSSELGGVVAINEVFPIELARAMFIGMDPPKHDRIKALFQAGFTPKRIAAHEDEIREIVIGVLERLEGRESADLVHDVAQPAVSRVIGSFMGIPEEDDETWARLMNATLGASDPEFTQSPNEIEGFIQEAIGEVFERCSKMIAERRENPNDDLTSVLVHAEVEGERLEEHEIVMGFFLLVAAGNDSTKATYSSAMRALMQHPEQRRLLVEDPSLIPGAVEESLRMFPAFAHFRRTATKDVELGGQQIKEGDKVV